jgi:outer membrane protein assembly factor BamB
MNPIRSNSPRPALFAALGLLSGVAASAAEYPQWRGVHRDGVSAETSLAHEWPKEGPRLAWEAKDAGKGYSTPAVVGDRLYLCGSEGTDNEFVEAYSVADGQRVWRTRLGKVGNPDQQPHFPGSRSTPTVDGDTLYVLGSDGDLAAVAIADGAVRWTKNLRSDFKGKPGIWAYSESPLVDGDTLVCTPGGPEATLVALNKKTGEVLWKSPQPKGDDAAYASATVAEIGGVRQIVQMVGKGLVGVGETDGKPLWRYEKTVSRYGANIPSPLVRNGRVFSAGAGTGGGLVAIKSDGGAFSADVIYFSPKLPAAIGGSVLVGDHFYGTTAKGLLCVEFATGNIKWEDPSIGTASICVADGLLFLHGENGEVALADASPEGYKEHGRFKFPDLPARTDNMEKAWAYPVVANGRLYLRDHDILVSYDVRGAATR